MQYDGLRRLSGITGGIYGKAYTYRDISTTQTTTQVASVVYDLPTDQSYGYTYDNMGNIATYTDANGTVTYTYDAQGQLLSAADGTTTYTYTYDTVGNILTANGHTYAYGNADWKDLLTAYDGETITYDGIGNPLSYYNGTRWTFTWEDGRQLATATDGTTNVSYTYDSDGIRTSKTVNGVKHTYVYASGKLLRETYGDTTLDFFYSTSGQPYALSYNGTVYYYITNLQGDVMSIVDGTGAVVAEYEYDPYGNIISATGELAEVNPLRYRGYVFDSECSLYYLQSRYYDPSIGRFLNADSYASTGQGVLGNNMFAYCNNNPVRRMDPTGCFWSELLQELQNAINEATNYFAIAVGMSQADTIAVGPADAAAALMIVSGLIYCCGNATYNTLKSLSRVNASGMSGNSTDDGLSGIAANYGVFSCEAAANSMAKYLKKSGKRAEIITIHFIGGRGYIVSDMTGMVISENGTHIGVLYEGNVYCNVHPYGLPEVDWISDFWGTGTKTVLKTPI